MERWLPENINEFHLPSNAPICYIGARKQNITEFTKIVSDTFSVNPRSESIASCLPPYIHEERATWSQRGGIFVVEATRQYNFFTVEGVLNAIHSMLEPRTLPKLLPIVIVDPENSHTIYADDQTGKRHFQKPEGPQELVSWLNSRKIHAIIATETEVIGQLQATLNRIKDCLGKSGIPFEPSPTIDLPASPKVPHQPYAFAAPSNLNRKYSHI